MRISGVELQNRGIYHIQSRNLTIAVWSEVIEGFIGIREKFRFHFLDTEWPNTVQQIIEMWDTLPSEIRLKEGLLQEGPPVRWIPNDDLLNYLHIVWKAHDLQAPVTLHRERDEPS